MHGVAGVPQSLSGESFRATHYLRPFRPRETLAVQCNALNSVARSFARTLDW